MVDKIENPKPTDEPRMTFDYSKIVEELSGMHMQLMSRCHDYLSHPKHGVFMTADLKYAYSIVSVHPVDQKYFAFFTPGMGQLQPTRMQQSSMTASFIMSELMCRAFGAIPKPNPEPSLIQGANPDEPPPISFYQDDIFSGQPNFHTSFAFLRDHFFPRIEWSRLRLSFKKLYLFQDSVQALGIQHLIGGKIQILPSRIKKIMKFPVPLDPTGVRAFLGTIGITHRWIPNYSELSRPLSRLTGKVNWKWDFAEQLSFEILEVKSTTLAAMHGHDPGLTTHFYTDASGFAAGLVITQFHMEETRGLTTEVPILYDSFTFVVTQQKYPTYKRELCALVHFVTKYDYFCKNSRIPTIVHTDHKLLTHFLKSDAHEGIYGH